jgi:hypothetical protein
MKTIPGLSPAPSGTPEYFVHSLSEDVAICGARSPAAALDQAHGMMSALNTAA